MPVFYAQGRVRWFVACATCAPRRRVGDEKDPSCSIRARVILQELCFKNYFHKKDKSPCHTDIKGIK